MNEVLERVSLIERNNGWYVSLGRNSWRFELQSYAEMFWRKLARDENFIEEVLEHQNVHDWDKCRDTPCQGLIWQLVQGLN